MQKLRSFPILVSVLFTAFLGIAPPARADLDPAKIEATTSKLVEMLAPRVKSLDREMMTFHYIEMEQDPIIHSQTEIVDWAAASANAFFDLEAKSGDMQGVGLYESIDPYASRSYGGRHPVLFVLPLKAGTRILDFVSDAYDFDLSSPLKKELTAISEGLNCSDSDPNSGWSQKLDSVSGITAYFRNSKVKDCRRIITETYRRLNVQALMYSYVAEFYHVDCRDRSAAFNIIDPSAISVEHSGLFWDTGRFASLTLSRLVAQSFKDVVPPFYARYSLLAFPSGALNVGSFENLGTFERSAQSWRKRTFFSCGPKWSAETELSKLQLILKNLNENFSDDEIKQGILDWHRAYIAKFVVGNNFDITAHTRVRKIEELEFAQTNLPQDPEHFERWQKASDVIFENSGSSNEKDAFLAQLMEEPVPIFDYNALFASAIPAFDALYKPGAHQSGLVGAIYRRLGFGPRITQFKIQEWTMNNGSILMVATPFPSDAKVDYTDAMRKNKEVFLKVLGTCTEMMKSAATLEEIQASDCAIRARAMTKN